MPDKRDQCIAKLHDIIESQQCAVQQQAAELEQRARRIEDLYERLLGSDDEQESTPTRIRSYPEYTPDWLRPTEDNGPRWVQ